MTESQKTEQQQTRRERIAAIVANLETLWPAYKNYLDDLSETIGIPGADAARIFFVLGAQTNNLDAPYKALEHWAEHRLTQVEGLEALTDEQKDALGVSADTVTE